MTETREELFRLVGSLPDSELETARRFLEFLRMEADADEDDLESQPMPPAQRAAFVDSLMGKYAGVFSPVDEFCRAKQAEIDMEEARWTPQYKGLNP